MSIFTDSAGTPAVAWTQCPTDAAHPAQAWSDAWAPTAQPCAAMPRLALTSATLLCPIVHIIGPPELFVNLPCRCCIILPPLPFLLRRCPLHNHRQRL